MSETTSTPKSTSSLSAPASTRGEHRQRVPRNLARCLRDRFRTYSRLPLRTHRAAPYYCPSKTPLELPCLRAIGSRAPSAGASCGIPRCGRSLSMIDLSPALAESGLGPYRAEADSAKRRSGDGGKERLGNGAGTWMGSKASLKREEAEEGEEGEEGEASRRAASLVSRLLLINAWRRRRAEVVELNETIGELGQQVEHFRIQIVVLRRLLETENSRVGGLTVQVHRLERRLDDAILERDTFKGEKERMEEETKRLNELAQERFVAAENDRNELLSVQDQLRLLDGQISRDREKLLKLREDKRILLDKVTINERLASERGIRADKAESTVAELRLKLVGQMARFESAQKRIQLYSKELKEKEEERRRVEEGLKQSEEAGRALRLRVVFFESRLADREAALRRMETSYNLQLEELNELKERLVRQSQEAGWSSRMLQIAGSVVRAPRAILRTLSFLSATGPALPS